MTVLDFAYGDKTIQEFVLLFMNGQLNLEPGFQRDSVWTISDRKKLMESIFQNYPIPSVFLYRRSNGGKLEYDVIDGKQRLESVLMFQGAGRFRGMRFSVKTRLDATEGIADWNWQRVQKQSHEHLIMGYKVQTVEISGNMSDIIDLFVRINSTGKRLTGQEKRHARFFHSDFLKQAGKLAEKKRDAGWRAGVMIKGKELIVAHHERFQSTLKDVLAGDGLPNVTVHDTRKGSHGLKVAA